jgi:hypothetical protein
MRWQGRNEKMFTKSVVGNAEWKIPFERCRWSDHAEMDLRKMGGRM